jgi:hypothetical protein
MRTWSPAQLAERPAPVGVPTREQRRVFALDGKTVRGAPTSLPAPMPPAPMQARTVIGAAASGVGAPPGQWGGPRPSPGRGQEQRGRRVRHAARRVGPDRCPHHRTTSTSCPRGRRRSTSRPERRIHMTINWGALGIVAAVSLVIAVLVVVLVSLAVVGSPHADPTRRESRQTRHSSSFTTDAVACPAPRARAWRPSAFSARPRLCSTGSTSSSSDQIRDSRVRWRNSSRPLVGVQAAVTVLGRLPRRRDVR